MWCKMISCKEELSVGKYNYVLEIGVEDSSCTCSHDDPEHCSAEIHNGEYVNVPHEHVPDLIRKLIELYPDWDKEGA